MGDDRRQIEEIKEKIDIVPLVEKYLKLKKTGQNYTGVCPFHDEKTPSFSVSPNLQRYKCFGCGESGDIFNFVQKIENIEFFDALKKLADEAGIVLESSQKESPNSWLEEINDFAMNFYHRSLSGDIGKAALKYLKDRGITPESIRKFKVGYAPSYNALYKELKLRFGSQYTDQQLEQCGLFSKKDKGLRDKFIDRVMFPIWSASGRVVGFSGRQTPGNDFGPKYLNTPETALFYKSAILLGIFQSKNEIRKADLCILVEGNLDVIAAHQFDIKNILAPMGTAITDKQLELVSRYTQNVLFLFDSDSAGQKAVERGFKLAAKLGLNVFADNPEPYQDLDDMLFKDLDLAKKKVNPHTDAFTYLITLKQQSYGDYDPDNPQINREIHEYENYLLEEVEDENLKDIYRRRRVKITKVGTRTPQYKAKELNNTELRFLSLALNNNFLDNLKKLDAEIFSDRRLKEAIKEMQAIKKESVQEIIESSEISEKTSKIIEHAMMKAENIEAKLSPREELNAIFQRLQEPYINKLLQVNSSQLAIAEEQGNDKEINRLTQLSVKLTLQKKDTFS